MKEDLCVNELEILLIEVHLPFQQPTLIGCVYRPPKSNIVYMNNILESIDLPLGERFDV